MTWPIFREGRLGGGAIFEKVDVRYHPFSNLSRRTIGYINENEKGAGLEYSFNKQLGGQDGYAYYQKIAGGDWKPVFDANNVKAVNGLGYTNNTRYQSPGCCRNSVAQSNGATRCGRWTGGGDGGKDRCDKSHLKSKSATGKGDFHEKIQFRCGPII